MSGLADIFKREKDPESIKVHITNPDDIATTYTREVEPEHFVFSTLVVAFNTPGFANYEIAMMEDPLRVDGSIMAIDNPIIICHTMAQVTDPANQAANTPYPQGGLLLAGSAITFTGTGKLYVVATVAAASRVSLFINRRAV